MLVYEGTKASFSEDVNNGDIADIIREKVFQKMGRRTQKAEYTSWENSLKFMYQAVSTTRIPDDCGVAIEYNVPLTAKRVDFMLSGYDKTGKGQVNIVELKQWSELSAVHGRDAIVSTFTGGGLREVPHPSYQAWSYAKAIEDFNEAVQEEVAQLHPCAYLHNYVPLKNDPIFDDEYREYLDAAPLFTSADLQSMQDFLSSSIASGDDELVLRQIDNGKIKPSKSLQDALRSMLEGNSEFVLLDEQKVVYEKILSVANACRDDGKKRVVVIEGGPGTGKSVVAINLLVALSFNDMVVQYVTKNSAPRTVYKAKLKGSKPKKTIDMLFSGPDNFFDRQQNSLDVALVDEAHRLRRKSGMFNNLGENQIKEIIEASKCAVFFIDESQRVTLSDAGSKEEILKYADQLGAEVVVDQLSSQFRCNGSDGYLAWLDDVLDIRQTANYNLEGIDYDFQVLDDPAEMQKLIVEKNGSHNKARLLAGYCWNWPKDSRTNTNFHDIKIGDWGISWNLDTSNAFALDEKSINEAGCIHSTQGLEFDYVGVIIGEDLRFENGEVVCDYTKRAKTDQSIKGLKKLAKENPAEAQAKADEIIKNTYRTLMTRGMKGCYVYCVDKELASYLQQRVGDFHYEHVGL